MSSATATLTDADLAAHQRLGIPPELLEQAGVRRVTDYEAREQLSSRHPGNLAGVLYVYCDPATKRVVTCRLRRDHPEMEDGKPKDKYLSAYGDHRHLFFPPGASSLLTDTSVPVVIVEAEKSVLSIVAVADRMQRRVFPIGTGGCWGWRGRRGKAVDANGARVDEVGPLPNLDRVNWTGRIAIVLFDSNVGSNAKVKGAYRALASDLARRGAHVRLATLPTDDPSLNGPDDLVAARGDAALCYVLDTAIPADKAPKPAKADVPGGIVQLADPDPWPDSVDGVELFSTIQAVFDRFAILPEGAAVAATLWTAHTYAFDAFWISPIAALASPTKRCGKTTVLMIVSELASKGLTASSITPAALFRAVERYRPTLLLDEAECWLKDNEELRGLVNGGHTKRTAVVIRTVGEKHEPAAFATWCPKLIALIGRLPETLTDRSILIPMRRKTAMERVDRLRQDQLAELCAPLRRQLRRWADDCHASLGAADPVVPEALHDRAADNWRPLLAIADTVGGDWPSRARAAALLLSGCEDDEDQPAGVLLLSDLRTLLTNDSRAFVPGRELVAKLKKLEDRPWATWGRQESGLTGHALAALLRRFGVRSRSDGHDRGYDREPALAEAWARYLDAETPDPTCHPTSEVSKCQSPNNDGAETPFSKCQDEPSADTWKTEETPTTTASADTLTLPQGRSGDPDVADDDEYRG